MKKRIIVCGYPKSGNTWLTRLTAEIVGCPVAGYWFQPWTDDEAIEGTERISDHLCFKSHHCIEAMNETLEHYAFGNEKIIYLMRDPRDVLISARHYFSITPRHPRLHGYMSSLPGGKRVYDRLFHTESYLLDTLAEGLIKGTREGSWLHIPWKEHVSGYLDTGALVISYEDLQASPLPMARKICDFLNINRADDELTAAIDTQSFHHKKQMLLADNQQGKAVLLRRGRSGEWKETLPADNVRRIEAELGDFMAELGYAV